MVWVTYSQAFRTFTVWRDGTVIDVLPTREDVRTTYGI